VASSDGNGVSRNDQKRRMNEADCSAVQSVRDKGRDAYKDRGEDVDGDAEVIRLEGSIAIIVSIRTERMEDKDLLKTLQ